jgi:hypothetical protein
MRFSTVATVGLNPTTKVAHAMKSSPTVLRQSSLKVFSCTERPHFTLGILRDCHEN